MVTQKRYCPVATKHGSTSGRVLSKVVIGKAKNVGGVTTIIGYGEPMVTQLSEGTVNQVRVAKRIEKNGYENTN